MRLVIAAFVTLLAFSSCGQQGNSGKDAYIDANPEKFSQLIESGEGNLVDVRTPGEYAEGHIPGAKNFNVNGGAFKAQVSELDKKEPVYVYCRSGGRSVTASKQLKSMGFEKVYNLEDGFMSWQGAQMPTEK